MALTKSSVNLLFALIVAGLGLTAAISYFNSDRQQIQAQPAGSSELPENHPPLDVSEKITALQQLSAREPQNPDYPAQIGNLYYDSGQYDKAVEYYQRSLDIRPRDPNIETDLATCLHYLGKDDRALQILDNVLTYSPGFTQAKFNKGIVLIEAKKDVKGGIAVWEELLRSDPGYAQRSELENRIKQLKASIR